MHFGDNTYTYGKLYFTAEHIRNHKLVQARQLFVDEMFSSWMIDRIGNRNGKIQA